MCRASLRRAHLTGDGCDFSSTAACCSLCPPPILSPAAEKEHDGGLLSQLQEEEDGSAEAACSSSGPCENVILAQVPASRAKLCKELGQQWC